MTSFDEAVRRFQDLLGARGWPTSVRWIAARDVERRGGELIIHLHDAGEREEEARRAMEPAGAIIEAICALGDQTCATIEPGGSGLRLVVPQQKEEGGARWPVC